LVPRLPARLRTANKRIDAAPEAFVEGLAHLHAAPEPDTSAELDLQLIGRRELRSKNSWLHNLPRLMVGADRCTLLVHPSDAAGRGLPHGGRARVRSACGAVEVAVEVTDAIMPGVVSLPHGYGHGLAGVKQSLAAARPGVNVNLLIDPEAIDSLGTTAILNGVPVAVTAAD